jgi:hypothetical protein
VQVDRAVGSPIDARVTSNYANNLGSADRRLGVSISTSGITWALNTAYQTYNPLQSVQAQAWNGDIYRINMNAHFSSPTT